MLSRPFAAPPGIPAVRAKALAGGRSLATHRDPLYLADAARRVDVSPITAEQVMQALGRIESAPPQLLDYLRRLFPRAGVDVRTSAWADLQPVCGGSNGAWRFRSAHRL